MSDATAPDSCCWGMVLTCGSTNMLYRRRISTCTGTGRSAGKKNASFKDRFCSACCRDGVLVPTSAVCAMVSPTGVPFLQNSRSAGSPWTVGHVSGCSPFRVVNHTTACNGPQLVIFDSAPTCHTTDARWQRAPQQPHVPTSHQRLPILHPSLIPEGAIRWIALPVAWLSVDGQFVPMRIAHGTLIPRDHVSARCAPAVFGTSSLFSGTRSSASFPINCATWVLPSDMKTEIAVVTTAEIADSRAVSVVDSRHRGTCTDTSVVSLAYNRAVTLAVMQMSSFASAPLCDSNRMCRVDTVESRMRGIAVLALLELHANRLTPLPALD